MSYCTQCGHPVPEGNRFCNHCGAPVVNIPQGQASPSPTVPQQPQKPVAKQAAKPTAKKPFKFPDFKLNRKLLFGLLGVAVVGAIIAAAIVLWPSGNGDEGFSVYDITEEELAKYNPDAYYPPNHGHSKAFYMQPRKGLSIHAEAGAFERDVNIRVKDLTQAERLQVYDKVEEEMGGGMIFAWDVSAGLPSDSVIPGQYTMEFNLRELGVPENLWPYIECFRTDGDKTFKVMNGHSKDGIISIRACQNSTFGAAVVAGADKVLLVGTGLLTVGSVAGYIKSRQTRMGWEMDKIFTPSKWRYNDVVKLAVKDPFGDFNVYFRYSETERGKEARDVAEKLQTINQRSQKLYLKANNKCRKNYKGEIPAKGDGEAWTRYLLEIDSTYLAMIEQDAAMKQEELLMPKSIQELVNALRLAERFCRSEEGLGLKPLSYTYDVYVADASTTDNEVAVARPVAGYGANIAIKKDELADIFPRSWIEKDEKFRRMNELRRYKVMVSVAHELSHVFEYEYMNIPEYFKNDRFLEAIGSVCEHWFVEWAHKKGYINMSVKEILANDKDKKADHEIFASREWRNMLAWPLGMKYPDDYFGKKAENNGGYMLGEFVQYLYDHKHKSNFDEIMSNYSWGKSLVASLKDGFKVTSEAEFARLYEECCFEHMDAIFANQQSCKKNNKLYLPTDSFDQYVRPVMRVKNLGHEGKPKAYPYVIKTTTFKQKKDPKGNVYPRYSMFVVPSEAARDSTKLKFVLLEGKEHRPSANSRYTRPWTVPTNDDNIGATLIYKPGIEDVAIDDNFYFDVVALYEVGYKPTVVERTQDDKGLIVKMHYNLASEIVEKGYVTGMAFSVTNNRTKLKKTVEIPVDNFPLWQFEKELMIGYEELGIDDPDSIDISIKSCWYYRSYDKKIYTSPYSKATRYKDKREKKHARHVIAQGAYPVTKPTDCNVKIGATIYNDGRFSIVIPQYVVKKQGGYTGPDISNLKITTTTYGSIKIEGSGEIEKGSTFEGDPRYILYMNKAKSNEFSVIEKAIRHFKSKKEEKNEELYNQSISYKTDFDKPRDCIGVIYLFPTLGEMSIEFRSNSLGGSGIFYNIKPGSSSISTGDFRINEEGVKENFPPDDEKARGREFKFTCSGLKMNEQ